MSNTDSSQESNGFIKLRHPQGIVYVRVSNISAIKEYGGNTDTCQLYIGSSDPIVVSHSAQEVLEMIEELA